VRKQHRDYAEWTEAKVRFWVDDDYPSGGIRRLKLIETPWFSIGFNHMTKPTNSGPPHNHLRAFVSLPLIGWYEEERADSRGRTRRIRKAGRPYVVRRKHYHRISDAPSRGCWSFVINGSKRKSGLGFWMGGEHVDREKFFEMAGKP